ncbi:hypothetical protein GOV12_08215 [Candidatus Pacearchaeota archaeon]|nr:hypothetical protein [Candidatus Pacearchaeota archaeon]
MTKTQLYLRINCPNGCREDKVPPHRLYLGESGKEIWKDAMGDFEDVHNFAMICLGSIIRLNDLSQFDYMLGVLWKDDDDKKMMDMFPYKMTSDIWPGNPTEYNFVLKNGVFVHENRGIREIGCETGDIIRAREAEHRRRSHNLLEFLNNPPHLGDLQPLNEFQC